MEQILFYRLEIYTENESFSPTLFGRSSYRGWRHPFDAIVAPNRSGPLLGFAQPLVVGPGHASSGLDLAKA